MCSKVAISAYSATWNLTNQLPHPFIEIARLRCHIFAKLIKMPFSNLRLYLTQAGCLADARYASALGFALVGFAYADTTRKLMTEVAPWLSGPGLACQFGLNEEAPLIEAMATEAGLQVVHLPAGHAAANVLSVPFIQDAALDGTPPHPAAKAVLVPFVPDVADMAAFALPALRQGQEVWLDVGMPMEGALPDAELLKEALYLTKASGLAMRPKPAEALGLNDFTALDELLEAVMGES